MKWGMSSKATRLLQEGICSYYLSLAVIYIAHDSTDGQADAMARWDNHSSEGWNRRCCSWRKRCAWREMDGAGGQVREWTGDVQVTEPDKPKEGVSCCLMCKIWVTLGSWGQARLKRLSHSPSNKNKREGAEMLILDLQEDCPSAVLLGTDLTPETSGKIHTGTSEGGVGADLTEGTELVLTLPASRISGRNLGYRDTAKKCCDSEAWMECWETREMPQQEEKDTAPSQGNTMKKGKSKDFSSNHCFGLISWYMLEQMKDGAVSAACLVSADGEKRGLVLGESPKILIQPMTGTICCYMTPTEQKDLCFPQARQIVSLVHFFLVEVWWLVLKAYLCTSD